MSANPEAAPSLSIPQKLEALEQFGLAFQYFATRRGDIEPFGAINLGKRLHLARPRRPFHAERIANERLRIPIVLDGPHMNALAARLPDGPERSDSAPRLKSGLFNKFAKRCFI